MRGDWRRPSRTLMASHINPCTEDVKQRKSGYNGILFTARLDQLFDRHLTGFQVDSKLDVFSLLVSPRLSSQFAELAKIGVITRLVLDVSDVKFSDRPRLEDNLQVHLDIRPCKIYFQRLKLCANANPVPMNGLPVTVAS